MAAESTTRDALIAEMLGDIGRLHESVESLKTVLPGQTKEVEAKITGLIDLLSKAGDTYRGQLETFTNSQADKVRAQMEKDAQAAKARFESESRDAIRAALTEVERTVKNTMQKALGTQQQSIWETLGLCIMCALIGGLVVVAGNAWLYDKDEAAFASFGKSVAASWDKLDRKAKAVINAERKP